MCLLHLKSLLMSWGYVGIIYNKKFVNEADLTGWELLWNNAYAGKILMFDNPRDAFAIAEADLGISLNSRDFDDLRAAADLLRAQKNLVQSYVMDQIFDKMERGEAWIAPYYAGDYLTMVEVNPDLGFYLPNEGYNRFVDAICIPKGCEHKKEAETFINFLISPEICGQNLEYLGYSSPYSASKAYMSEEVAENEIAYPSEEQLANGQIFQSLGEEATQEMNRLWLEVKASDASTTVYLILTGAAVASIIPWALLRLRRRRKKAQRCAKWRSPA